MKNIHETRKKIAYVKFLKRVSISLILILFTGALYGSDDKKNGKIIFSDNASMLNTVDLENSKNNFNLMEDLYLRVLIKEPLSYYFKKYNYDYDFHSKRYTYNYAFRIKIDGKEQSKLIDETSREGFSTSRTMAFPLSTGETVTKRKFSGILNHWVKIVKEIDAGEHLVEIELVPYTIELVGNDLPVLASGKFTLNVKNGEMQQFIAKNELDLPEPTMKNPEVEEQIVDASSSIIRRAVPVKALITDVGQDWDYSYDENGNILYRHIVASVVYKLTDDESCIVNSAIYTQKHQGYGDFGPMTYSKNAEGYYDYQVPCDVIVAQDQTARTFEVR